MRGGGTMVAIGSSGDTAKALLNLPADKVTLPSPFAIPGSLMRVQSNDSVPGDVGHAARVDDVVGR